MKVEILYVPDCPHFPAALAKLKQILAEEGIATNVAEVSVSDLATATALQFCGSPSIRINGLDVAIELGGARDFAVSCRLYPDAKEPGAPHTEMIRQAVRAARLTEISMNQDVAFDSTS